MRNDTKNKSGGILPPLLEAMRPAQWTKNAVVLAAFVFAYWDHEQSGLSLISDAPRALAAAGFFCLLSSAVYLQNDIFDLEADRAHPRKRSRPLASGRLALKTAFTAAALLASGAIAGAYILAPELAFIMAFYLVMQICYSAGLKKIVLLDAVIIALGFVIRAVAGALALNVNISNWLLACTFLLALFLGLCKRRSEKKIMNKTARETVRQRPALKNYHSLMTDKLITVTAAATIICYTIYTIWPGTVSKFSTHGLIFTVPFVVFGIFRYLFLVYHNNRGDRPEDVLLSDLPTIINLILYALSILLILS